MTSTCKPYSQFDTQPTNCDSKYLGHGADDDDDDISSVYARCMLANEHPGCQDSCVQGDCTKVKQCAGYQPRGDCTQYQMRFRTTDNSNNKPTCKNPLKTGDNCDKLSGLSIGLIVVGSILALLLLYFMITYKPTPTNFAEIGKYHTKMYGRH